MNPPDDNTVRMVEALARITTELARTATAGAVTASILGGAPLLITGLLACALAPTWVRDWVADTAVKQLAQTPRPRRRSRGRNRRRGS